MKEMTFDDETGDYSSVGNFDSVNSKEFNNKLNIENIVSSEYAEIGENGNVAFKTHHNNKNTIPEYAEVDKSQKSNPQYATVDLKKKREERLKKLNTEEPQTDDLDEGTIYEDIENAEKLASFEKESNIYELVSSVEYSEVHDKLDTCIYAEPERMY